MKHGYLPRSLPSRMSSPGESRFNDLPEEYDFLGMMTKSDNHVIQHVQNKVLVFTFNSSLVFTQLLQTLTLK